MGGNAVETLIGAVVLAVAGIFLFFAYSNAGVGTERGYQLNALFDRVDGLNVGSDVRLSGIKVGSVTAAALDPKTFRAKVTFTVHDEVVLPDDSAAKIASQGLLGGNYLQLDPGGSDTNLAPGGTIKYTQGAVDLMGLIGQAVFSYTGGGKSGQGQGEGQAPAPGASPAPAAP
jgi:phospholipid/cholesterol/gamma-HCH transport system substrate-binding protein